MGRQVGSQYRKTLKEAGYRVVRRLSSTEVILREVNNGIRAVPPKKCELWVKNNHYVSSDLGHVIEILGSGYVFVRTVQCPGAKRSPPFRVNSQMNIVAKSDMRQHHKKGSRRTSRR